MRKTKTNYYGNLTRKCLANNKQYCRTVKPLLSEMKSNEKITSVDGAKILTEDGKTAETLSSSFSSAVRNLNISEYRRTYPTSGRNSHRRWYFARN